MNKNTILDTIKKEEDLSKLIEDLLIRMGLNEVHRESQNLIKAIEKSTLKNQKIFFLITLSELNGKVEIINERIKKIREDYDQLYVITLHNKQSDYFKTWLNKENPNAVIEYWNRNQIISNIDDHYEDFWSHNDSFLKPYELSFNQSIKKDLYIRLMSISCNTSNNKPIKDSFSKISTIKLVNKLV